VWNRFQSKQNSVLAERNPRDTTSVRSAKTAKEQLRPGLALIPQAIFRKH
jgi:hypothetical protein